MIFLYALIGVYASEWLAVAYMSQEAFWYYTVFAKHLETALCLQALFSGTICRQLRQRSIIALLCCVAWVDVAVCLIWIIYGVENSVVFPASGLFFTWLVFVVKRNYQMESDPINHNHVMLLLLKPTSTFSVIKSLLGFPVSSVCILCDGYVYSYRVDKETFTQTKYAQKWLERHFLVDTGAEVTEKIKSMLTDAVGTKKGMGWRCVYTIRYILAEIGTKFKPATIFHYHPGIYAAFILGGKNESKSW